MREKGMARKLVGRSMEAMEETATSEQEKAYQRNLDRVKDVISKLKEFFELIETSEDTKIQSIRENKSDRIQELRDELERIEDQKEPKTVIAIVGATGEGKSSLINALLDHRNVLPTSGHRACTAVVVEVVDNAESDKFEADIEFRSKAEWSKERECLQKDLTTIEGRLKTQMPDSSSESYASYLKIMAVYGKIDNMEEPTEITDWLGKRKTVVSSDPEEFRQQVEQYIIQSEDTDEELQYWPIVERVRLKIPNCDVCSSGAKLVDLPGVSDYNAARENVTKEYLKTCKAVWVVSSIHRAIDAKMAKNLLDENFRRQLLMDGHYANIAFICSKTDDIVYSECTKVNRRIGVQGEVDKIREEIIAKEKEKSQCNKELQSYREETNRIKQECDHIKQLQSGESTEEPETINEQIEKQTQCLSDVDARIDQCKGNINAIEQHLVDARKQRSAICAKARNKYSSQQIKKDFKAGLREMKSEGRVHDEGEDDDEDEEEDEGDNKLADSLHVFCCSATEYQRIQNPLPDDEPPKVFSDAEETEVPQLRDYVHTVTQESKIKAMDFLISTLSRLVSDVQNLMTNSSMKNDLTAICKDYVEQSNNKLKAITKTMSDEVGSTFTDIEMKLKEGAIKAEELATATCYSWGNTQTPRKESEKSRGPPYHFKTYLATIYRNGVFRSPKYNNINFNNDLVLSILCPQTTVWDQVFNHKIPDIIEKTRRDAYIAISKLVDEMLAELAEAGYPEAKDEDVILYNIMMRLNEMSNCLRNKVDWKQRDLSRLVEPYIQSCLGQTYFFCSSEKGKGTFQRIKDKVLADIDRLKDTMFHDAVQKVIKDLKLLKDAVIQDVEEVCGLLVEDLKTGLKYRTVTQSEYGALITDIKSCAKILRPPGTLSSSQGSQQDINSAIIQVDPQEGIIQSQEGKTQSYGQSEVGSGEPARGSSVSPLKRKLDYDEQFKDLKRQKKGKDCYKPGDLDQVLKQSRVEYEEKCHIEQKLKENCSDNGLEYHGNTPGNGDCFFEAIASQLSRIGAAQSGSAISPLQLRVKVSEYIRQNPTYEGPDGPVTLENYMDTTIEQYCEKMAKCGTWADHVVVITMARMLEHDIVIVTSSPSTSGEVCLTWVIGDSTKEKPPLLLAHLWENHYQSLQPIVKPFYSSHSKIDKTKVLKTGGSLV